MSVIRAALTPEEWRDGYHSDGLSVVLRGSMGTPGNRVHVAVRDHPLGGALGDPRDVHALAALCLHGQPFGFTWEDVEFLRAEGQACIDGDLISDTTTAAAFTSLADRIEALLPPREK